MPATTIETRRRRADLLNSAAHAQSTTEPRQRRTEPLAPGFTDDPLLTAREAAAYRRQGLSTFWRDVRNGTVPQPLRVTPKAPRWRLSWLAPQHADAA